MYYSIRLESLISTEFHNFISEAIKWLMDKSVKVLIAVLFLAVGLRLVAFIVKLTKKSFERRKVDISVSGFLLAFIKIGLSVVVFITTAAIVGIEVTSFVTVLGTAGIALSLGLQGSLSNLVGGILILILKPFVVGDYIREDNKGNEGSVETIDIFYTRLRTPENRIVVIPNGILANTSLVNITTAGKRRMDITVSVSYEADIDQVKEVAMDILNREDRIIKTEEMEVFVDAFEDSGIRINVRGWSLVENYWACLWKIREDILRDFRKYDIEIPYNKLEVDVSENKNK